MYFCAIFWKILTFVQMQIFFPTKLWCTKKLLIPKPNGENLWHMMFTLKNNINSTAIYVVHNGIMPIWKPF